MTSPLNPAILDESCSTAGVAAVAAESRKHVANVVWTCVPLAVETYGIWGGGGGGGVAKRHFPA